MVRIDAALSRIKDDWRAVLSESHIEQVCREAGLKWRHCVLDPVTTIFVFLLQVPHRNTAITSLPRLAGKRFTSGAYCQARRRFGQPCGQKRGCGFPVAHLLMLVDAHSGLILDVLISPLRTHDLRRAAELHPHLRRGDVAVADRAYCSYGHVAVLFQQDVFVVFRMHQRLPTHRLRRLPSAGSGRTAKRPAFEFLSAVGPGQQIVLWHKPPRPPLTMPPEQYAALPACLVVRVVSYTIKRPGYRTRRVTLLTTLLDPQTYPAEALVELYGRRWQIEVNFGHLKQTLGLDVLRCKTADGGEKEIVMFALVYNLVRAVMLAEAERYDVPPDRIRFVDALRHLSWPPLQADSPLLVNPLRPGRIEPRVRKRRPKQYPLMQEPRSVLRIQRGA